MGVGGGLSNKAGQYTGKIKTEMPKQTRTILGDILICTLSAGEKNGVKTKRTSRIFN